jgi:hypothetical protein
MVGKSDLSGGLHEVLTSWTYPQLALALDTLDFYEDLEDAAEKEAEKRRDRRK